MKRIMAMAMVSVLIASWAMAGDTGSWFDMEKCEFCKPMMETKGLMSHMKWEHHNIADGTLSITKVDDDYVDAYKKAEAKMDVVAKRWMGGEKVYVCNMCKSMGAIMQAGAKTDNIESGNTFIQVTSSTDPEVVNMIHGWTDRTNSEMKAMAQKETPAHKY